MTEPSVYMGGHCADVGSLTFTFTFTFGEGREPSSAEAVITNQFWPNVQLRDNR